MNRQEAKIAREMLLLLERRGQERIHGFPGVCLSLPQRILQCLAPVACLCPAPERGRQAPWRLVFQDGG